MDSAVHYEKTLSSEVIFEGRVITLTNDVALLENGETARIVAQVEKCPSGALSYRKA